MVRFNQEPTTSAIPLSLDRMLNMSGTNREWAVLWFVHRETNQIQMPAQIRHLCIFEFCDTGQYTEGVLEMQWTERESVLVRIYR